MNGNVEEAEVRLRLSGGKEVGNTMRELQKEGNKLRSELRDLTPGTQKFIDKSNDLAKVERAFKGIKDEIQDVKDAQYSLKESFEEYFPWASKIQVFVKGFRDLKKAKDAATASTKLLNLALLSSGFGAIVVILGSMYAYLTGTTKGTNLLRRAWEPLNQVIQRFIGFAQELGEYFFDNLIEWFTNPISSIKAFGNAIVQNVINRFTAIAKMGNAVLKIFSKDWKQGLEDLANAVVQAGTGIENGFTKTVDLVKNVGSELAEAAKDGARIAKLTEDIANAEREATTRTKELAKEYKRLSEIAEDTSKSAKERAAAAEGAKKMAEEEFQVNKYVLDLQIEKMQLEQKANDTSYEGQQELADLIAKREELETAMIEKRTTANSKFNTANQAIAKEALARQKEQEAAEQKARDEKLKAEEELNKKLADASKTLQDLRIEQMDDETDQRIAKLLVTYERELAAFQGSEEQKAEYALLKKKQLDRDLEAIDNETKAKRQEKALADLETQSEIEEAKIEELFYSKLISEEQRNEQLYQLQVEALQKRLALLVANGSTETLEYQKLYTQLAKLHADYEAGKTKQTEDNAAKRQELEQKGFQAASSIFAGFADLLASDEESRKKNWETIKALKKAEIASNLPTEISNIWKNANLFPVPFNGIIGFAQTALAVGRSIKQMSDLNKVKYRFGGPVFGPSHANGGIPFSVAGRPGYEMEGGEIIMTKGVYQNPVLRSAASMINVAGGGAAFASGGVVPMATAPGSSAGTVVNNITNTTGPQDSDKLVQEVRALREELAGWQSEFQVVLNMNKLNETAARMKQVELDTSF